MPETELESVTRFSVLSVWQTIIQAIRKKNADQKITHET